MVRHPLLSGENTRNCIENLRLALNKNLRQRKRRRKSILGTWWGFIKEQDILDMTEMIKNGESLKIAEQWWSGIVNYEVWSSPSQKIERKWKYSGRKVAET